MSSSSPYKRPRRAMMMFFTKQMCLWISSSRFFFLWQKSSRYALQKTFDNNTNKKTHKKHTNKSVIITFFFSLSSPLWWCLNYCCCFFVIWSISSFRFCFVFSLFRRKKKFRGRKKSKRVVDVTLLCGTLQQTRIEEYDVFVCSSNRVVVVVVVVVVCRSPLSPSKTFFFFFFFFFFALFLLGWWWWWWWYREAKGDAQSYSFDATKANGICQVQHHRWKYKCDDDDDDDDDFEESTSSSSSSPRWENERGGGSTAWRQGKFCRHARARRRFGERGRRRAVKDARVAVSRSHRKIQRRNANFTVHVASSSDREKREYSMRGVTFRRSDRCFARRSEQRRRRLIGHRR